MMFVDNCDSLCTTYLKPMADAEISAQIQDWSTGGGLLLDYCNLLHSFAAYNKVSLYSSGAVLLVFGYISSYANSCLNGHYPSLLDLAPRWVWRMQAG